MTIILKGWVNKDLRRNYAPEDWEEVHVEELVTLTGAVVVARVCRYARGYCRWEIPHIGRTDISYQAGEYDHIWQCKDIVERLIVKAGYKLLTDKHMALL